MKLISSWLKINRSLSVAILTSAVFCALFGLETFVSAKSAAKSKPQIVAHKLMPAVTPKAASQTSPDYVVTVNTGASIVPGTDDAGIDCDDCTNTIALPFTVQFYDETFTSVNISSNGLLEFTSNDQACCGYCLPQSFLSDVIAPLLTDLITNAGTNGEGATEGVFTSVSGTAPNRIFNIEWVTNFICDSSSTAHFEVRLYEGQSRIDFIYGTLDLGTAWTSENLGIGVQRDTGSQFTEVECATPRNQATLPASGTQYTFTIPTACATPPSGMVSWWPGDGDANDIQSGNDGTLENGAGFAAGEVRQAFSFNGSQDVSIGDPADLKMTTGITIDAWINPSSLPSDLAGVLTKWHQDFQLDSTSDSYALWINNDGGTLTLFGGVLLASGSEPTIQGGNIPLNAWTHVAMTYDSVSGTMTLYVNGTAVSSFTGTPNTNIWASDAPIYIGSEAAGAGRYFPGLIDEVEVFNRALTGDELQSIHAAGNFGKCRSCTSAPAGMIAWWPGEGNGNDVQGHLNGNLNDVSFAPGLVSQAFTFNGTDSNVQIPDSAQWNFGTGDFTFDFWENSNVSAGTREHALSFEPDPNNNRNLDFDFNDNNGIYVYWNGGGSNQIVAGADGAYTDGQWHHVALTRSNGVLTLYIDGANVGSATYTDPINLFGTGNNFIGSSTGQWFWNGQIDEVEVFDRALSQREIQKIYDAQSGGKCPCVTPPDGMTHWWTGDGSPGDIVGGTLGTLHNGATYASGEVHDAFSLDSSQDQYVQVGPVDFTGTSTLSLDVWVNPNDLSDAPVVIQGGDFSSNGIALFLLPGGFVEFDIFGPAGQTTSRCGPIAVVGEWHHIVATYDGNAASGSRIQFYGDGVFFPGNESTSNGGPVGGGPISLKIGSFGNTSESYGGRIDEVELFNRVLSANEAASIYNAAGAGKCKPTSFCYNGHQYLLTSKFETWTDAEAEAQSLGGHLVAINDPPENNFVIGSFLQGGLARAPLWIGLTDFAPYGGGARFRRVRFLDDWRADNFDVLGLLRAQ